MKRFSILYLPNSSEHYNFSVGTVRTVIKKFAKKSFSFMLKKTFLEPRRKKIILDKSFERGRKTAANTLHIRIIWLNLDPDRLCLIPVPNGSVPN